MSRQVTHAVTTFPAFEGGRAHLGSTPNMVESGPSLCHTCGLVLHAEISFACCKYWCCHMSAVIVPGSALNAMRSISSRSERSPVTRNATWSEYSCSTTAHSSIPRLSSRPPKHSSAANIPCGWPWKRRCASTMRRVYGSSVLLPDWRYHTAAHLVPWALLTP